MSSGLIVVIVVVAVLVLGLLAWIARSGRDRAELERREAMRDDLGHRSHAERARSHR